MDSCHDVVSTGGSGGKGGGGFQDGVDDCLVCWKSLSSNLLGGKHHCLVVAEFKCCGKWTSQRARYEPNEERVMGQRCERCREFGSVVSWQLCDDAPASFNEEARPHRSHLCEACDRYGDCTGAFFDPFTMSMAISMYTGLDGVPWQRYHGADIWSAEVSGSNVLLQPHVFAPRR